jgi:hypothetical protein
VARPTRDDGLVQRVGAVDCLRDVEARAVLEEQLDGGEAGFDGLRGAPIAVEDVDDGGADSAGRFRDGFGRIGGQGAVEIRVGTAF